MEIEHSSPSPPQVILFDPRADLLMLERRLLHQAQAGAIAWITRRIHDSMPKPFPDALIEERNRRLRTRGNGPANSHWQGPLLQLDLPAAREFRNHFWNRWHDMIDAGHGARVLRQTDAAEIIASSLLHCDQERCALFDFVIVPSRCADTLPATPTRAGSGGAHLPTRQRTS